MLAQQYTLEAEALAKGLNDAWQEVFKDGTARGCGRIVGDVIANAFIVPKFTGKLQLLVVNPVAKKTLVVLDRIAHKTTEALRPFVLAGMLAIDIERATPEELMAACRTFERNFKEYAMYAEKIAGKSCSEKQLLASMGGINQAIGEGINAFEAAANQVAKTEGLGLNASDKVLASIAEQAGAAEEVAAVLQEAEGVGAGAGEAANLGKCILGEVEGLATLRTNAELSKVEEIIENLKKITPDIRYGRAEQRIKSAAKYLEAELAAEQQYAKFRAMDSDVSTISRNLKVTPEFVQQVKDYVFYNANQIFRDLTVGRFPASIEMAEAWERLIQGNFIQSDLVLVLHEYAESVLKKSFPGATASHIHDIVQAKFNWIDLL